MNNPSITPNLSSANLGNIQTTQPAQLREGQLFHGTIKQLYPGEMAEVQIGNQKLNAKLEVPLKAGDSYYFQVKATEPELQLKLVSGPHAQGESQSTKIGSLLDTLQLTKTPEMRKLVDFFMKQQIPITRESLIAGETLLKETSPGQQQEALQSLGKLVSLKLPITPQLFQAMMGIETKAGLQGVLDTLQQAVNTDTKIPATQKMDIQTILQQIKQPLLEKNGGNLLAQTLSTALDKSAPPELRFQAVQLLKTAGILPAQTSLANLPAVLAKLVSSSKTNYDQQPTVEKQMTQQTNATSGATVSLENGPKMDAKQVITSLLQATNGATKLSLGDSVELQRIIQQSELPTGVKTQLTNFLTVHSQSNETASALLAKFSETLFSEATKQMLPSQNPAQSIVNTDPNPRNNSAVVPSATPNSVQTGMPALLQAILDAQEGPDKLPALVKQAMQSEAPVIHSFLAAAEAATSEELSGSTVKQAIQSILAKMGVHYEASLVSKDPHIAQIQDSLKPQLVALLQEGVAGAPLREAAETAVSRLNGQLLQSTESGVQQQIIMQVPLQLQGKRIDATLEWNGRMKEDGKIDPNHARVLFYLDLESLKKTVVDMQVQNKVVTLTIFNEDPTLKMVGELLQDKLSEGLDAEGYQLSAVRFKPFQEELITPTKSNLSTDSGTQGVDFRI
ncbi:hypothetical protein DVB69_02725 [Sporosarcina sp. BI001-red]|uniref:hypothetical protein n=1 Tax=Sporosarcina sp. BI001-red TaxID=2282866 RepID=UPI000E26762D|nr:hypothetical protein [Sporosarcina sp. BI001-red]REB09738.1 hypothetical protein DVB69_02725 [Sporosarcina sp. BI001-red]